MLSGFSTRTIFHSYFCGQLSLEYCHNVNDICNLDGPPINVLVLQLNLSRSVSVDHTMWFWETGYQEFINRGVHNILSRQ